VGHRLTERREQGRQEVQVLLLVHHFFAASFLSAREFQETREALITKSGCGIICFLKS
jgi:hypothetical protein